MILSHGHDDHYAGLRELFKTTHDIDINYFFENKDASTASGLTSLRDSINARVGRAELVYRNTDDPCTTGAAICTILLDGGAKLHILKPKTSDSNPNNRSVAVKLVGPDSASFSMWMAGDADTLAARGAGRPPTRASRSRGRTDHRRPGMAGLPRAPPAAPVTHRSGPAFFRQCRCRRAAADLQAPKGRSRTGRPPSDRRPRRRRRRDERRAARPHCQSMRPSRRFQFPGCWLRTDPCLDDRREGEEIVAISSIHE